MAKGRKFWLSKEIMAVKLLEEVNRKCILNIGNDI